MNSVSITTEDVQLMKEHISNCLQIIIEGILQRPIILAQTFTDQLFPFVNLL
jgi:hypothetical protein